MQFEHSNLSHLLLLILIPKPCVRLTWENTRVLWELCQYLLTSKILSSELRNSGLHAYQLAISSYIEPVCVVIHLNFFFKWLSFEISVKFVLSYKRSTISQFKVICGWANLFFLCYFQSPSVSFLWVMAKLKKFYVYHKWWNEKI